MRPVVIIDGNNLIKAKYALGNKKIPKEIFLETINALNAWAQNQNCMVDLCLDPHSYKLQRTKYVSLFMEKKKDADSWVEERTRLRVLNQTPCMVVTTDGDLQKTANLIGSSSATSQDFISGHGPHGFIFLPKKLELPWLLPPEDTEPIIVKKERKNGKTKRKRDHSSELEEIHLRTLETRHKKPVPPVSPLSQTTIAQIDDEELKSTYTTAFEDSYALSLATWPVQEGIRFLIDSACQVHRSQLQGVIGDTVDPNIQDMFTLLDLLRESCRDEPDFVSRSGSLMKKVKRVLVKHHPTPLTFSQIDRLIGQNTSGMQKKIEKSIPVWLVKVTCSGDGQKHLEIRNITASRASS